MATTATDFFIGTDSGRRIGEKYPPEKANNIIQDLTYVAVLKDFGAGSDKAVPKPSGDDATDFGHSCNLADPATVDKSAVLNCDRMMRKSALQKIACPCFLENCRSLYLPDILTLDSR